MRNRTWLLLAVLGWWTLSGLVWVGQIATMHEAAGQAPDWSGTLRKELASAWLWVPLTLFLFECVRRQPIERGRVARALCVQGLAVLAVIVLRTVAVLLFNRWIGWYEVLPGPGEVLFTSVLNNTLSSWMIVGVAHAGAYAARARQRERQALELESRLARARLEALSAQLNPHFLFNALNSIAEMVHRDPDGADRMLVDLGALLRHSLDNSHNQEIALRDELVVLDHYLGIEKIRLGERLQVEWAIDSALLDASVPQLLLQPLVENAIHHAVATRTTPGAVSVSAQREADRLILEVSDDGGQRAAAPGPGVGLSNTRARLQCLYGNGHRFEIGARPAGGTCVRLQLPYRRWVPGEAAA
ncbi:MULTISPECIES: sensor histidine kinase [Lysobacter]|uniref:Histidine kinase n=1 Tax=Lysobacter firmicutimachus TaxID=1792846 RepID=A0ABU8D4S3_9GAMM|nr:histidine kinase [Lysobacter antibioticus]